MNMTVPGLLSVCLLPPPQDPADYARLILTEVNALYGDDAVLEGGGGEVSAVQADQFHLRKRDSSSSGHLVEYQQGCLLTPTTSRC